MREVRILAEMSCAFGNPDVRASCDLTGCLPENAIHVVTIPEDGEYVFILRIRLEPREVPGDAPIWRGTLEDVRTGTRRHFKELQELHDMLAPYVEGLRRFRQGGSQTMSEGQIGSEHADELDERHFIPGYEGSPLDHLRPALLRLDRLLAEAVISQQLIHGPERAHDPYRGLYINTDEVTRLLQREPAAPVLVTSVEESPRSGEQNERIPGRFRWLGRWLGRWSTSRVELEVPVVAERNSQTQLENVASETGALLPLFDRAELHSRLAWLARFYGLSDFDLDVLLIALAPDLDLRYERLYAFLQDDVSRRRPGIDLTLNLLCRSGDEKIGRRSHFSSGSPLIRNKILRLTSDRQEDGAPLLSHFMRVDEQVVRFLIGEPALDSRLAPFADLTEPTSIRDIQGSDPALLKLFEASWDNNRSLRVYFQGNPGSGKRHRAEWVAASLGTPLLVVNLARALAVDPAFDWVPGLVFREALFHNALLYASDFDDLRRNEHESALGKLWDLASDDPGITIFAGSLPWSPIAGRSGGVVTIEFPVPGHSERRTHWERLAACAELDLAADDFDALAGRFRLTLSQIDDAFSTAFEIARLRNAATSGAGTVSELPGVDDFFSAARAQTGHELAALTHKIVPVNRWDDIVLPPDVLQQLREICQRINHGRAVLDEWGFNHKLSQGTGTTVLFAGPSGTGKTMAAEILSSELGLDLYRIDLSGVVSKYIGETEKNLERIFRAAENSNALLFFDEADALFGKRSEVRDSHDRYANIEISYLLQKMESYSGIAILATNLRQNLDDSFVRRMAFTVSFPFPDEESRRRIWEGIWPDDLPRDFSSGDLDDLAARFRLSGGNIKNVALAAAYLAAEAGRPVTRDDLLRAIQREYQKMGKTLSQEELLGNQGQEPVAPLKSWSSY